MTPDQEWEKTGTKGAAFAAPFSDGVWYDEKEENTRCGIWQVVVPMQPAEQE
ncbi:hypothetical protein SFC43_02665 [Bacteroides sp. CR5/BHMF/2]|nr:hypothetical protein [Bacteroides sp. CR5/BHMF/2]